MSFRICLAILLCTAAVFAVAMIFLAVATFRLVSLLHGGGYAAAHVFFMFALAPVFLLGPMVLPLLVQGDYQRLRSVADQAET